MRIALSQINCTVGDFEGNSAKIKDYIFEAREYGSDIVVFPELSVCGYPPEDLLYKRSFIDDNLRIVKNIASSVKDMVAVVGFVDRVKNRLFNAAAIMCAGKIVGVYHKMLLPNYGVFDERRYFDAGTRPLVFRFRDSLFGLSICEDIWHKNGPTTQQARLGARCIININASPYHTGKLKERETVIRSRAKENKCCIAYVNLFGGQDELVFDGSSMLVDSRGKILARAESLKEDMLVVDVDIPKVSRSSRKGIIVVREKGVSTDKIDVPARMTRSLSSEEEIYNVLLVGLRDYCGKNGFKKVVIGLSGGIDSSIVAALAADALGKENVTGIFMPSRYSSGDSEADARELAANLGIEFRTVSIEETYKVYLSILEPHFAGKEKNSAEENLQARIRGNILMAFSNKFGWLVLTTGNKSEMSTGYATLYGDMAGGFAVIKDVPKMLVYKISRYRNSVSMVIPERVFTKEPTAELKENQKDSDTLPVYSALDPILKSYVEDDVEPAKIIAKGFNAETVKKVIRMVDASEYKRRQSPPGVKITPKAFGKDRRMPITNKYKG